LGNGCRETIINVLLGCTFAFKVRVQGKNRIASEMKVSSDFEIVDHVKRLLPQ